MGTGRLHTDPGERERITRDLLAVLARHKIPAVGFVIWGNVRTESDRRILEMWLKAGHELGNHSLTHPNLTREKAADFIADAEAARAGLAEYLKTHGRTGPRFFRFPMLREGETAEKMQAVRDYLAGSGQRSLPVTIDDQDYAFEEPWVQARRRGSREEMAGVGEEYLAALRTMVRHHEGRGDALFKRPTPQVLLLHANEIGAAQWDRLFSWLESEGHRFASADEVLADPVFAGQPEVPERFGFSLWDRIGRSRENQQVKEEIERLLRGQAEAWKQGDLEAFTSVYADDALFMTPNGLTRGRAAVLDRYRKHYPDAASRGILRFEFIEILPYSGTEVSVFGDATPGRVHAVSVAARWILQREGQPESSGWTLLVLRRMGDRWLILEDASM